MEKGPERCSQNLCETPGSTIAIITFRDDYENHVVLKI